MAYLLQSHKMKYNIDGVKEATCPLCFLEDEDLEHILLRCPALSSVRGHHLTEVKRYLHRAGPRRSEDGGDIDCRRHVSSGVSRERGIVREGVPFL